MQETARTPQNGAEAFSAGRATSLMLNPGGWQGGGESGCKVVIQRYLIRIFVFFYRFTINFQ